MMKSYKLLILLSIFVCSSCVKGHKYNYFYEGHFISVGDTGFCYELNIRNISKDEYESSNGKNTVLDLVLKNNRETNYYFSIELFYLIDGEKNVCDFYGLKDSNPDTIMEPITYVDSYSNTITPKSHYPNRLIDHVYTITYNSESIDFSWEEIN